MAALPAIAAGMGIAGNAVETYSKVQSLKSQEQLALETSQADERNYRYQAGKVLAQRRAMAAGSGVDPSSGSPLLADLDAVRNKAINELTIRRKGQYEANYAKSQITPTILTGFLRAGSQTALIGSNAGAFSPKAPSQPAGPAY